MMKRLLSIILAAAVFIFLMAPVSAAAETVQLNKTKLTLDIGKSYTLKITGTTKTAVWGSSNRAVATVSSSGKVKAIKVGKATITAGVSGRKYNCEVTVKEGFNEEKAIDHIDASYDDFGIGVLGTFSNNYSLPFTLDATVEFYDDNGDKIGEYTNTCNYFEKSNECVYFFYAYDDNYNYLEYSSYSVEFSAKPISGMKSNVNDISLSAEMTDEYISVEATNDGNKHPINTLISIIFYKDGSIVGYNSGYVDVYDSDGVDSIDFYYPQYDDYSYYEVDDYKVYVNDSYYYE